MSRVTIRAAMVAWLQGQVAGINTVYSSPPSVIAGTAFFGSSAGTTSGCVATISVTRATERRVAVGGATSGKKRVDYDVTFQLHYLNVSRPAIGSDQMIDAQNELDAIVDALKARIRADRTASSGAIWQWGEQSLDDQVGDPALTDGGTEIEAQVTTQVTEWLTS